MTVVRPRRTALELAEQELSYKLKRLAEAEDKLNLILKSVLDLKDSHRYIITNGPIGCGSCGYILTTNQRAVQRAVAREVIRHLNIIVRQDRKLSGRGGKRLIGVVCPTSDPTSCATIPGSEANRVTAAERLVAKNANVTET
eukprot:4445876-Pyramimonas_sp.AAC.1